jgi:hypothetical protein
MPASFVNGGFDLFRYSGGASICSLSPLDGLNGAALSMYDSFTVQVGETTQFFLCFDDIIRYIHFGKALGTVQVDGTCYCDCSGDVPGAHKIAGAIQSMRGKAVTAVLGSMTVTAVLTSGQATALADPDTMVKFSVTLAVIDMT